MNDNHRIILNNLRDGAKTTFTLSYILSVPEASIRRLVHELRNMGWNIVNRNDWNAWRSYYRVYQLKNTRRIARG